MRQIYSLLKTGKLHQLFSIACRDHSYALNSRDYIRDFILNKRKSNFKFLRKRRLETTTQIFIRKKQSRNGHILKN